MLQTRNVTPLHLKIRGYFTLENHQKLCRKKIEPKLECEKHKNYGNIHIFNC